MDMCSYFVLLSSVLIRVDCGIMYSDSRQLQIFVGLFQFLKFLRMPILPKVISVFIFDILSTGFVVIYIYDKLILHLGKGPLSAETYLLIVYLQETL